MGWVPPTPDAIADQASTDLEEGLREAPDGGQRTIDARSPRSVLAVIARVIGLALYPVYLFLVWISRQVFPDSCDDEFLAVHARIWGVDRQAGAIATGSVILEGDDGTSIPAGTRLTLSGAVWTTSAAGEIGVDGTVTIAVLSSSAGAAGNQAAGTSLALEVPIVGLTSQAATVTGGGITGGADIEAVAAWRKRLIDHIRERPHGGADFDYGYWVKAALPAARRVKVHPAWTGAGTVGVVVAMLDDAGVWRAPTSGEITTVETYLADAAPVTATVVVLPAIILAVDVTVTVYPWSNATEAAVRAAARAWFRSADMQIAGRLHLSRLRERLSRAAGEDWHQLVAPAGETITLGPRQIAVLGNLTVTEAS